MAFDPNEFLKEEEAKKKLAAAPAAAPAATQSGEFDPVAFLADPANAVGGGAVPAMVAEIAAPSIAPGTPMATPPEPNAVPQLPVSGYGPGMMDSAKSAVMSTRLGQNAAQIVQPYATAGTKVLGQYAANPFTKLAPDLASVAAGFPPPYATSQAIGATQGAFNVAKKLPSAPVVAPVDPLLQTQFGQEIARRTATAQAETLANRSVIQKIAMSKVMQTMGSAASAAAPVLNTAARVAGPAGMAYNVYEAGQMAKQTQLGPRLAAGQGQQAEQAFRQMNVPYGSGFTQTITADQARAALASQNPRDIQALGGMEFLRKKALGQ